MSNQRVVVVTGASSGIGRACAMYLATRGWQVWGASRRTDNCDEGVANVALDVDDDASVERGIGTVLQNAGRIDAVVNNAGFGFAGSVEDTSPAEARAQLETNVIGVLRICRAVLPHMRARGSGHIVNVSSIAGRVAVPFQGIYCASKFAVEGLTEALRHEVADMGIAVALVEPGDYKSGFTDARRMTIGSGAGSAYVEKLARALASIVRHEQQGPTPEPVAQRVAAILESARPRLRHPIGRPLDRMAVALRPWIPAGIYERMIRDHYDV